MPWAWENHHVLIRIITIDVVITLNALKKTRAQVVPIFEDFVVVIDDFTTITVKLQPSVFIRNTTRHIESKVIG